MDLIETLSTLRALLINTCDPRAGKDVAGFTAMNVEDQQTYLAHCAKLADDALKLAETNAT